MYTHQHKTPVHTQARTHTHTCAREPPAPVTQTTPSGTVCRASRGWPSFIGRAVSHGAACLRAGWDRAVLYSQTGHWVWCSDGRPCSKWDGTGIQSPRRMRRLQYLVQGVPGCGWRERRKSAKIDQFAVQGGQRRWENRRRIGNLQMHHPAPFLPAVVAL